MATPYGPRRVLVALDFGSASRAALDAAAQLAAGAEAELEAVFVEDERLHRLSRLPIARVVGYPSGAPRAIDAEAMDREFRAHAARLEALVRAAADRHRLRSSFRVTRGDVAAEVRAASAGADLVLISRGAHPAGWTRTSLDAAHALALAAERSVVLMTEGRGLGPPAVLYDASPASERALAAAAYVADRAGGPVAVLAAGVTTGAARRAGEQAAEVLAALGRAARVVVVGPPSVEGVLHALPMAAAGMLVVGTGWPADAAGMRRLLEDAPVPVMIVR